MHVDIKHVKLKDINNQKKLQYDQIKKYIVENDFDIFKQIELKVWQSGQFEGAIRWPNKEFVIQVLSAMEPKFVDWVLNICKNHNAPEEEIIKDGITIIEKFSHLIDSSKEQWPGKGKVQKLVSNKYGKQIREEIMYEKIRKKRKLDDSNKDDQIDTLMKDLAHSKHDQMKQYMQAVHEYDKNEAPLPIFQDYKKQFADEVAKVRISYENTQTQNKKTYEEKVKENSQLKYERDALMHYYR